MTNFHNNILSDNGLVVGIGEVLWDLLPSGRRIGGAPANFAYHVKLFGFECAVASAVGHDSLGDGIIRYLNGKGISLIAPVLELPTGVVEVSLDSNGIPSYDILERVAWDFIPCSDVLMDVAKRTYAVCFGSLAQRCEVSRNTIVSFLKAIPAANCALKVFDLNLRQNFFTKEAVAYSLDLCNVFKINDEEFDAVCDMFGYDRNDMVRSCCSLAADFNLKLLILTCGVNGSYIFSDGEVSFLKTPVVNVADTVGAGDAFTAAVVAALLKGRSIRDSHRIAVNYAAFICTQFGAMPFVDKGFINSL